nr:reverse transcriptase domain-containing protein [Tanacetum cinerariifolium]
MSGNNPLQTAVQMATIYLGEPSVRPTPITQDARGPSDMILESDLEDPIMQFVSVKAKEKAFVECENNEPPKNQRATPLTNMIKGKQAVNNDFYHEPFMFKESEKDVHDLVTSPFTKRIRDYDMPDGIEAPTNLRAYDGMTDSNDDLTAEILGIRQRPGGSLKDYVARFSRETLHMADRSDIVVSGTFISGLRPGRLFKDLIAKSPMLLEDLFIQTHNFIRVEDANNENRFQEPRLKTKQHLTYKDFPHRTPRVDETQRDRLHFTFLNEISNRRRNCHYMTGILRELAEHKLNIHPRTFPMWQKKRVIAKGQSKAITMEVSKLVEARILKLVYFPRWVFNPVMVKKSDRTWRMCIEFMNLNKACPKDSYPLPEIDQKIESLEGFKLKCFLDTYKGYHRIGMAKKDEEKMAFHTKQGTFCYVKMPLKLKNVRATYQRLIDNVFSSQLGRNIEIYVDYMVIKSKNEGNLILNIAKTFDTLRKANMKLNPKKYTFRVEAG